VEVELRYFTDCPNWRRTHRLLAALRDELGFELRLREVTSPEQAEALAFPGSPTVLVDGHDPFPADDAPVGLACRVYDGGGGPRGTPPAHELRAALERAHGSPPRADRAR
jgi:hypothetical protein